MRIRYVTGPAAGEVKHVENSIAQDAIDSGRAVLVLDRQKRTAEPPPITWEVVAAPFVGLRFRLPDQIDSNGAKREIYSPIFFGNPDDVNAKRTWDGGERYIIFGRRVPDDAVERYRAAWKANKSLRCNIGAPYFGNNEKHEQERQQVVKLIKDRDTFASQWRDK